MDFLNGKIKPMYLKYLAAAFGKFSVSVFVERSGFVAKSSSAFAYA